PRRRRPEQRPPHPEAPAPPPGAADAAGDPGHFPAVGGTDEGVPVAVYRPRHRPLRNRRPLPPAEPGPVPRPGRAGGAVLPRPPRARPAQTPGDGGVRGVQRLSLAAAPGLLRRRRVAGRALRALRLLPAAGVPAAGAGRGQRVTGVSGLLLVLEGLH